MLKRTNGFAPTVAGTVADAEPSNALHRFMIESLSEHAVFAVSLDGLVISWNSGAQRTFGYAHAEIVGRHFSIIFTPGDIAADEPAAELRAALAGNRESYDRWHVRRDATRFWGTNTVQPIADGRGEIIGFAKLVQDSTAHHLALQALGDSEERLRLLIESVSDYAIFSLALDGTITTWNSGAQATFGYADDEIIGRPLAVLHTPADVVAEIPSIALHCAVAHGHWADERWMVRKDGTHFLSSGKLSQLKRGSDGRLRGFVNVAHDITEPKRISDDMRWRALNDQLTKLPNRAAFYEHVQRAIAALKRDRSKLFAVLFIDLDEFKAVNDQLGHVVADKLLEYIARRLENCIRSGDIIARLGGDEFAILLNGFAGLTDATDAAERIGVELSRPVSVDGHQVRVTASVGITQGTLAYHLPEDVLRDADIAMYVAKENGRARAVIFDATMTARHDP